MSDEVRAFAPASIGNVGVGFDMLGLALGGGAGDTVIAARSDSAGISIDEVLWDAAGVTGGAALKVHKGVPLQSGMGSSAASAVAAVVAVNALLDEPLDHAELLPYALEGEKYASGGLHADNVAPSLLGGLVLCPTVLLPEVVRLPVPTGVSAVLLHPELQVNTAHARRGLARGYSMQQWLEQQGYLAGFIAGCMAGDVGLIGRTLRDVVIEPQRAAAVPCFADVKAAAMRAGALGCSLSGSGPSIFALCEERLAANLASAMEQACRAIGIDCQSWVSPLDAAGARVEA